MTTELYCYRVWMKDGYASLHDAETEEEARRLAIEMTRKNIEGAAMTPAQRREALAVDYVDKLD